MATNKHALLRYKVLDYCFSNFNRRYYVKDLVEACNRAISEYYGYFPDTVIPDNKKEYLIKRRATLYEDINFMREHWGAPIDSIRDGQKVYYRYSDPDFSISKQPITEEEMDVLKDTLLLLNRFKGMPQFDWMEELVSKIEDRFSHNSNEKGVIGFEQNKEYEGTHYLSPLFHAILNKQPLTIKYQTFKGKKESWLIHPYYLKQYNNRWYLLGLNDNKYKSITIIPLDRIQGYEQVQHEYIPSSIDFDNYFNDVIGVTKPSCKEVEKIILKFDTTRFPWVRSKPLHKSMSILDEEKGIISIEVIPNQELESLIFSFGEQVQILSPDWLCNSFKEKISRLYKNYLTCTLE